MHGCLFKRRKGNCRKREEPLEKSNRRLIVSPLPLYLGKGERGKTAGLVVLYRSPTTAKKKKKKTVAVQMVIIGELCLSMYKSKGSQQTIKTTTTKCAYCLMSAVFSVLGHRVLFFFSFIMIISEPIEKAATCSFNLHLTLSCASTKHSS